MGGGGAPSDPKRHFGIITQNGRGGAPSDPKGHFGIMTGSWGSWLGILRLTICRDVFKISGPMR